MLRNHPGLPPIRQPMNFQGRARSNAITRNHFTFFYYGTQGSRDGLEETEIQNIIAALQAQRGAFQVPGAGRGRGDGF